MATTERTKQITPHPRQPDNAEAQQLLDAVWSLRNEVVSEAQRTFAAWQPHIQRRAFLPSALNLAQYLAFRRRDQRTLQDALTPWGLSSLGRSEGRVLANLDAVLATLGAVCQDEAAQALRPAAHAFWRGERLLRHNAVRLFGVPATPHRVPIMVTLPSEAADNYELIAALVASGMNCARINCAHDTAPVWEAMSANVRRAARDLGRSCRVLMDLGGPKVRIDAVRLPDSAKSKTRVVPGDRVLLTGLDPARVATTLPAARCSLPEILAQVQVGQAVWIDDGKIGTTIEALDDQGAVLRVVSAPPKGGKLAPEKGLNFPDTDLRLAPLRDEDRAALDVLVTHADIIGYSFVQRASDVALLQVELRARLPHAAPLPPIITKIETRRAVENLPEIIVEAAGHQPLGVMIARGDLAVEIGYQRLAEVQEEMLWLCEAAHVPVIWATQVLEGLVKKGTPSRAEMTDAAMAERAECVMLNKGPYIVEAVQVLDDVLRRMREHQEKKTPRLRALHLWTQARRTRRAPVGA
jgi:pyruvate kinase